jgi:hypothetical protein
MANATAPSFSASRRVRVGLNVAIAIVALLAIVVMVNYLAVRHFRRWYLSDTANAQLHPLTLSVLRSLTNQVRVVVFFDSTEPVFKLVEGLLKEYKLRADEVHRGAVGGPRLGLEIVDPDRNPGRALELKKRFEIPPTAENNFVLFECQGKRRIVRALELSDYAPVDWPREKAEPKRLEFRRSAFKGELMFTSALVQVSDPLERKACFLQGHNEQDPENEAANDQTGFHQFALVLGETNIRSEKLFLIGTNDVPADCSVLIVAGPTDALLPSELDKIQRHLTQGGRLLVLLRSLTKPTGVERLLANWGVEVGEDVVLDRPNTIVGTDVITTNFTRHPLVQPLRQSRLHLVLPRSVGRRSVGAPSPDTPRVEELVLTGVEGRAATDIRDGAIHESPRDRRGPIPLMVAVEKGGIQGVSADRGSTRLVVVGEALFLSNAWIGSAANREFASLAVNWLLDRPELIGGLGPRPVKSYKVVMTDAQLNAARWIFLGGLPGGVMLLGALVWLRRRS